MYQQITVNAQNLEVATNSYLHHDHLGNIVAVTNPSGVVQERLGYSALGNRISLIDKGATAVANLTKRGFTGHEQFELLNIVHMNGRIYDPTLGRFLQVDPVVQDPSNGQNYNRYTYVWNNPLAYTDPTGMISMKNLVRQIVGIYVSAYLGSNTNIFGSMAGGTFANSMGGLVGSYVAGGKNNIGLNAAFEVGSPRQSELPQQSSDSHENGTAEESYTSQLAQGQSTHADPSMVDSKGRMPIANYRMMLKEYQKLAPLLASITGRNDREVADKFGALAVPFTRKWGFEVGANIVRAGKTRRIDDVALGDFGQLNIEENPMATADVHTHPSVNYDAGVIFSGSVTFTAEGGIALGWGDMRNDYKQNINGFVYLANGKGYFFNQTRFRADLKVAMSQGRTLDSRWTGPDYGYQEELK
jgi:RHS repeat-associated protein